MKQNYALLLAFLITALIASNVYILSNLPQEKTTAIVQRVIDGDTLVLSTGEVLRLININSPEKSKPGFEESTAFLKQLENQTIEIERLGPDKYGRTLARIQTKVYINLKIVEEGFANKYLVRKDELSIFAEAEEKAIENEKGIWKKSENFDCLTAEIIKSEVLLTNSCQTLQTKNWRLKDESRKEYNFSPLEIKKDETITIEPEISSLQNGERNSVYIFNSEGELVLYHLITA